jgi:hypothetical protein
MQCVGRQARKLRMTQMKQRLVIAGVLVDLVRLIKANAPDGAEALPSDIAPALEETVRAHFALRRLFFYLAKVPITNHPRQPA